LAERFVTERELQLVFQAPWGRTFVVVAVLVGLAILALSAAGYRRLALRAALALFSLRALAVLCALAVLLQPAVRMQQVRRSPGRVALLLDAALSMSVRDGDDGNSRWQRARAVLGTDSTGAPWLADHPVDLFSFGGTLSALAQDPPAEPSGATTRLAEAIEAVADRVGEDLGGVVVVSDGIDHGRLAANPDQEAQRLGQRIGAPVHAVWAGRSGLRDVSIAALRHDDFAFVRTPLEIEVDVRSVGYPEGEATVRLERDGEAVATRTIALGDEGKKVSFQVRPNRVGDQHYAVVVPPRPGEALLENNRRDLIVRAMRDRIRVLHVCGRPSWDQRFLRRLLKREPNIDLISFFILRTPSDLQFINPGELSLIPFPTEELFEQELFSFDLLIMQNFAHGPYGLSRYLVRIRDWVERGGGLAIVGGDLAFHSGGWAGTPVADVLPLEVPDGGGHVAGEFRARLREGSEGHPIVRLAGSSQATRRLWEGLPPLDGANRLGRPADGATVLAEHPRERAGGGRLPVLAVREAGEGRTLLLGTDSSWRWSFLDVESGGDGRAYDAFWRTAIRWLIHDPDLERVRLELPDDLFAPGAAVPIVVRVYDRDFAPAKRTPIALEIARLDAPAEPRTFSLASDDSGLARLDLASPGRGAFRVRAHTDRRRSRDERVFVVAASGEELGRPDARDDLLRALARETGGTFRASGESLRGLRLVPSRRVGLETQRDLDLWAGLPMLLLALAALAGEWILRRRWGLS